MEAVATSAVLDEFFHSSFEPFYALTGCLKSSEARGMDFSDLEKKIEIETRERKRRLLQDHLNSRGPGAVSLFPKDGVLNLPEDSFSHGVRRAAAIEAARGSFDEACASLERASATGSASATRRSSPGERRRIFTRFTSKDAPPRRLPL